MDHAPVRPTGLVLKRARSISPGNSRVRVVPWQGDAFTAMVGPKLTGPGPNAGDILNCLSSLHQLGVERAVTPALNPQDIQPFLQAGFQPRERLHLLAYPLVPGQANTESLKASVRLKAGRAWHRDSVIDIDKMAFESFWQFDRRMLQEARGATPSHRFRIATSRRNRAGAHDGEPESQAESSRDRDGSRNTVLGYAVTGRAGQRGYLQRLAVAPSAQGQGLGTALVKDSLRWLQRRGVRTAYVNTQERNEGAFQLYQRLGFIPQTEGLVVLSWESRR